MTDLSTWPWYFWGMAFVGVSWGWGFFSAMGRDVWYWISNKDEHDGDN